MGGRVVGKTRVARQRDGAEYTITRPQASSATTTTHSRVWSKPSTLAGPAVVWRYSVPPTHRQPTSAPGACVAQPRAAMRCPGRVRWRCSASLPVACVLRQNLHGIDEHLGTVRIVAEHVQAGAGGRAAPHRPHGLRWPAQRTASAAWLQSCRAMPVSAAQRGWPGRRARSARPRGRGAPWRDQWLKSWPCRRPRMAPGAARAPTLPGGHRGAHVGALLSSKIRPRSRLDRCGSPGIRAGRTAWRQAASRWRSPAPWAARGALAALWRPRMQRVGGHEALDVHFFSAFPWRLGFRVGLLGARTSQVHAHHLDAESRPAAAACRRKGHAGASTLPHCGPAACHGRLAAPGAGAFGQTGGQHPSPAHRRG